MKEKNDVFENESLLKDEKMLFAHWRSENKEDSPYQNWFLPLKKIFDNIILFDPAKNYFQYGKKSMNHMLLELVKKEMPDYIFFGVVYDEFEMETFFKIRKICPKAKLINLFSDDDWRFDDFSRYYAQLFDYSIILHNLSKEYKKEGQHNISFIIGVNCDSFRPLNLSKKYDISFFGRPNGSRINYLRYLINQGFNIDIWGDGWAKYPEFDRFYHGHLDSENLVKVINQSKINLGFTMGGYGKPQTKGRPYEVGACNSFILVEYFSKYLDFFNKEEIVMFKNKEELVKLIRYFLHNDKKRVQIAEKSYKRVIKKYNQKEKLRDFFKKIINQESKLNVDVITRKKIIALIKKEDLKNNYGGLKKKLLNYEYVSIQDFYCKEYLYKDYFQIYSLEKSGKDISCCDYYVHSRHLGNYLLFKARYSYKNLSKDIFNELINPLQLVFTRDYFIKNYERIKNFVDGKDKNIINENNTVFVSIPLLEINKIESIKNSQLQNAFQMKFLDMLYSLYYQKKISLFPVYLLFEGLKRNRFILNSLYNALRDKDKMYKLKRGYK